MIGFIIGFVLGGWFGFALAAVLVMAKDTCEAKWIPVTERLPGTGRVLITDGDIVMRGYRRPDGVWKYGVGPNETWDRISLWPVTHWMPLPEPPTDMRGE